MNLVRYILVIIISINIEKLIDPFQKLLLGNIDRSFSKITFGKY